MSAAVGIVSEAESRRLPGGGSVPSETGPQFTAHQRRNAAQYQTANSSPSVGGGPATVQLDSLNGTSGQTSQPSFHRGKPRRSYVIPSTPVPQSLRSDSHQQTAMLNKENTTIPAQSTFRLPPNNREPTAAALGQPPSNLTPRAPQADIGASFDPAQNIGGSLDSMLLQMQQQSNNPMAMFSAMNQPQIALQLAQAQAQMVAQLQLQSQIQALQEQFQQLLEKDSAYDLFHSGHGRASSGARKKKKSRSKKRRIHAEDSNTSSGTRLKKSKHDAVSPSAPLADGPTTDASIAITSKPSAPEPKTADKERTVGSESDSPQPPRASIEAERHVSTDRMIAAAKGGPAAASPLSTEESPTGVPNKTQESEPSPPSLSGGSDSDISISDASVSDGYIPAAERAKVTTTRGRGGFRGRARGRGRGRGGRGGRVARGGFRGKKADSPLADNTLLPPVVQPLQPRHHLRRTSARNTLANAQTDDSDDEGRPAMRRPASAPTRRGRQPAAAPQQAPLLSFSGLGMILADKGGAYECKICKAESFRFRKTALQHALEHLRQDGNVRRRKIHRARQG